MWFGGSCLATSAQIYCIMCVGQLSDDVRRMDELVPEANLPACASKVPCWWSCGLKCLTMQGIFISCSLMLLKNLGDYYYLWPTSAGLTWFLILYLYISQAVEDAVRRHVANKFHGLYSQIKGLVTDNLFLLCFLLLLLLQKYHISIFEVLSYIDWLV